MLNIAKWVGRGAALALCVTFLGCTTMQVDTAPSKRFAEKRYQTFSWRTEVPRGVPQSMESLYRLSATVQEVVTEALEKKGYRLEPSGGDFLVSYAFSSWLEGGQEPVTLGLGPSGAVINRTPDGAVMDNAYALSGPREVASLMLSFEDGNNLASVWSASISQVVENQNQPDLDKVQRKLKSGVTKGFRVLPDATNR